MNGYEKTSIKTMEEVLLNQYKAIINEKSVLRQSFLKNRKGRDDCNACDYGLHGNM
jgi:hypothetical protein